MGQKNGYCWERNGKSIGFCWCGAAGGNAFFRGGGTFLGLDGVSGYQVYAQFMETHNYGTISNIQAFPLKIHCWNTYCYAILYVHWFSTFVNQLWPGNWYSNQHSNIGIDVVIYPGEKKDHEQVISLLTQSED